MTQRLISHMLLKRKKWFYGVRSRVLKFMETGDTLDLPCIVCYCNVCRHQRSHVLVCMYIDSCLFECVYYKEYKIRGERKMKNEEDNKKDSVNQNNESSIDDTSKQNTGIMKADELNKIPSIENVLPNGEVFSYPLLEVFLEGGGKETRSYGTN